MLKFLKSNNSTTTEELPKAGTGDLRGPTPSSNWIIPGKLLTGSYPGLYRSDEEDIRDLLKAGVTLIIPLVEKFVMERWYPYTDYARDLAKKEFDRDLKFEYFPIQDLSVPDEDRILQFIPSLADKVKSSDEVIYIHCFSGHGRSGVVVSLLLAYLNNISGETAIDLANDYHSHRDRAGHRETPETDEQCKYVVKMAKKLNRKQ